MCCGDPHCNCWAFSSGGANAGCWPQNSSAPLQPVANKNVSGGLVGPRGAAPPPAPPAAEGFEPVGHAFRNRTASNAGEITHVVVWDASPGCHGAICDTVRENDRLTRCTVTVASRSATSSSTGNTNGPSLMVVLMNGTVHSLVEGKASFESDRVQLKDFHLYDAPLLVVRSSDAMPPTEEW